MRDFRKPALGAAAFSLIICLFATGCNTSIDPVGSSDGAEDYVTEDSEPVCGNGIAEAGEECDDGESNSDTEPDACRTDCQRAHCGDGVLDSGEECDGSDLGGATCESLGMSSDGLACVTGCRLDVSGCRGCGNGTCELGESMSVCRADCHDGCGNGTCEEAEDQFGCPADCGAVAISAGGRVLPMVCCIPPGMDVIAQGRTCAIISDGTVRCWGNGYGNIPMTVVGLSGAVDIATSVEHSCAIISDGTARCWGDNSSGQIGDGTNEYRDLPVVVSGLEDAIAISAGSEFTCAALSNGTAMCWGRNDSHQLGDGTDNPISYFPVTVSNLTGVAGISAGHFWICALVSDGTIWYWGSGLGAVPEVVSGLTAGAVDVSTGFLHICAVLADGTVMCWGSNSHGQLGDGTTNDGFDVPVAVSSLRGAVNVSAGGYHTCAVMSDGTAWCWGDNSFGQLGDGTNTSSNFPVAVSGITAAVAISVGKARVQHGSHSCALLADGTVWCWGTNGDGELGDGIADHSDCETENGYDCSNVPVQVAAW